MKDLLVEPTLSHPDVDLLSRYAANELGARRKKGVAEHLEECEDCRASVRRVRTAARVFRDLERLALDRYSSH